MRVWSVANVLAASSILLVSTLSCSVDIPDGIFACQSAAQCPEGWVCALDGFCYSSAEAVPGGPGGENGDSQAEIEACKGHVPAVIPLECRQCTCEKCTDQAIACNNRCWDLVVCVAARCPDADPDCVQANCLPALMLAGSADSAIDVALCAAFACRGLCG